MTGLHSFRLMLPALIAALLLAACASAPEQEPASQHSQWQGILPGTDCDQVQITLTLDHAEHTYRLQETPLPDSECEEERDYIGRWQVVRGNDNNPKATIYQLDFDRPETLRNFLLIDDDQLKLVDERGNEFWMPFNLVIERVSGEK